MNRYKIVYKDRKIVYDQAKNTLEIIRKYDLANKDNIETVLIQQEEVNTKC